MAEVVPIKHITKEAWAILLELAQTNDHEFPWAVPKLIERAQLLIKEMEKHGGS